MIIDSYEWYDGWIVDTHTMWSNKLILMYWVIVNDSFIHSIVSTNEINRINQFMMLCINTEHWIGVVTMGLTLIRINECMGEVDWTTIEGSGSNEESKEIDIYQLLCRDNIESTIPM